jgi:hypothetical protein
MGKIGRGIRDFFTDPGGGDRAAEQAAQARAAQKAKYDKDNLGGTTSGPLVSADSVREQEAAKADAARTAAANAQVPGVLDAPGDVENAYAEHGQDFFAPSNQDDFYSKAGAAFEAPGVGERMGGQVADDLYVGSQGSSYGQDFYEGQQGSGGMIPQAWKEMNESVAPDLGGYYDLAFQKDQRRLNRASAARGSLNSTAAMRGLQEASSANSAQQAKDEYTYKLERSKALGDLAVRGTQTMGELAFSAGDERREYGEAAAQVADQAQKSELERLATGFEANMGRDNTRLAGLVGGMNAADIAQAAREKRITYEQEVNLRMAEIIAGTWGGFMEGDSARGETGAATALSGETDANNQAKNDALARQQRWNDFVESLSKYGGGNGGSGGTGGATPTGGTGSGG